MIATRCEEDNSGLQALGGIGLVRYGPLRIEFNCSSLPEAEGGTASECYMPITQPPEIGSKTKN